MESISTGAEVGLLAALDLDDDTRPRRRHGQGESVQRLRRASEVEEDDDVVVACRLPHRCGAWCEYACQPPLVGFGADRLREQLPSGTVVRQVRQLQSDARGISQIEGGRDLDIHP